MKKIIKLDISLISSYAFYFNLINIEKDLFITLDGFSFIMNALINTNSKVVELDGLNNFLRFTLEQKNGFRKNFEIDLLNPNTVEILLEQKYFTVMNQTEIKYFISELEMQ